MAQVREDEAQLPPKMANQNRIRPQDRMRILLNGYNMDIRQANNEVYQFKLTFLGERTTQREGQPAQVVVTELSRGPRNDEAKETRRRLLWRLFLTLLETNPDVFGNNRREFVYDCGDTLFCAKDLGFPIGATRDFVVDVDRNALEQRCRTYIRNRQRILATLQRTATVNLRNANNDVMQGDSTVIRFLELLTTQQLLDQERHYIFGNRMYETESAIQLEQDPRILKSGMQKNVRFVGDNAQNAHPIVQIDAKKSAFYPGVKLLDYLRDFFNLRDPRDLTRDLERVNRHVRGLIVETTHMEADRQLTFAVHGLTNNSANQIEFERDGEMVTVARHFRDAYNYNLRHPDLPCVIHQMPQRRQSYYPIEVVMIVQGQRVSIDKQTPKLTEEMIKRCQVVPADVPHHIEEQRAQAMVQSGNPYFQAFGVRCEPDQIVTEASMLFQPAIQYNQPNERVEPPLQQWKTTGRDANYRQYAKPAKFPKTWVFIIVQRCVSDNEAEKFVNDFVRHAQSRGLADAGPQTQVDRYDETSMEYVSTFFKRYVRHNCMFAMFIAPGKRNARPGDIHQVMKKMEQEYSVLTQHISPEIMKKAAGLMGPPGGAIMVLENILMKTNLKLDGVNFNLVTSNAFKQAARIQSDPVADEWLGNKRMFIGIDFSHAPPQSLFERQSGEAVGIPTCVGMAYTIGKMMLRMRGTYWMQTPRQTTMTEEHVRPFIENIKTALMVYETHNSAYPEHLIVYRGGASEGEFRRICAWEGFAFERAFEELAARGISNFRPPAVTIVVCQRQSNYRAIPERPNRQARPADQNLQPGTVVDKNVMSATLTEFLLIGHKALQGTAQPVRCTVVYEHRPPGPAQRIPQMPVEEIYNITFILCYSHGNFAGSTALPGVLYSAGDLAKRGRNNWKMHTADGAQAQHFELPALGQDPNEQAAAQQQLNDQRAQYYAQLSTQLEPHIDSKFWA